MDDRFHLVTADADPNTLHRQVAVIDAASLNCNAANTDNGAAALPQSAASPVIQYMVKK